MTQPSLAQDIGAEAILVRIYESEASKLLSTADWYWRANDAISAELFIRRLVKQYPDSVATLDALRVIPRVIAKLPQTVIRGAPDYRALRAAKLGIEWDTIPEAVTNDAAAPATASAPAPAPAAGGTP